MIKIGIVGGTGYVAGELLRCLVNHPEAEIDFVYSHSLPGAKISSVHGDLFFTDLSFTSEVNENADVVFLSLGHGNSKHFLASHNFSADTKIIDLSNDFRLQADAVFNDRHFVYGLAEMNKKRIQSAHNIANPGCFATAIQLALLPLARAHQLNDEVHVHAVTGSTGAGQSLSETSHFSWRSHNLSVYKAFKHQHLGEISESIKCMQNGFDQGINFLPMRGDFPRGIFTSAYLKTGLSQEQVYNLFRDYYADAVFTKVTTEAIHLKQVVNTNFGLIGVQKIDDKVLVTTAIDNLLKGAAGQAIHNMNLMFGLAEDTGLRFKANYF